MLPCLDTDSLGLSEFSWRWQWWKCMQGLSRPSSGESLLSMIVDDIPQVSYFFTLWSGTSLHGESCGVSPASSLTSSASTSSILRTQPQVRRQVSPHLHKSSISFNFHNIHSLSQFYYLQFYINVNGRLNMYGLSTRNWDCCPWRFLFHPFIFAN